MKKVKSLSVALISAAIISVAQAEVVVVVSAKSTVAPLNKQQVSDIFLGKASAFPDGKPAVPLDQAEGATARDEFHGKVTGKSGAQLKSFWSKQVFSGKGTPPKEVAGSPDVKKLTAENPNVIGYVDKSVVDATLKVVFTP
jgi:ABC-type phosphate transport system substrate-binding protein